jgi:UDP-N-acetylmuramoylalanine--D-glutamate ligase
MDYKGKKVLICGIAKSGVASARLLWRLGADVTVIDLKSAYELSDMIESLRDIGATIITGKNPDELIKKYDLVIVSPGIPTSLPFFQIAFDIYVPVWSEVELGYSVCENPVMAITGTNGKTTTTALLGEIMAEYSAGSRVAGNIGTPFTETVLDLLERGNEDAYIVAEVSSFQLETTYTFAPFVSAVLNISEDHLDRHGSMENYAAIKERIFAKQRNEHFTVLNYDDPVTRGMADRTKAKVMFFSRSERVQGVYSDGEGIYVNYGGIDEKLVDINEMKIFGHNVENAMAAAGMAICANVPPDVIRGVLRKFSGYPHRIEYVCEIDGVIYYNDSKATNVDSAVKALESMTRPVVLIGGGKSKDSSYVKWVNAFHGRVSKVVVLGETADEIIKECEAQDFWDYTKAKTFGEAVNMARKEAEDGDCVLLSPACSSFDMFRDYEHRGDLFKEIIMGWKNG